MLSITNFKKQYAGNTDPVLFINHFQLDAGIYWIKGENGSGKTSLMKSIAGLIPFEGSIVITGFDIRKNRMAYAQSVNYAEAEPQYPTFLTGKELIDFYNATKAGKFPVALCTQLGVDKFMHQKTATYSSGMLKKLSLVLAFIGNPSLILLDEPLIALDVAAVEILQAAIREYNKAGVSFIITSHQLFNNELVNSACSLVIKDKTLQKDTV
jgi:ABC-2 type transport system ATP-binding protein